MAADETGETPDPRAPDAAEPLLEIEDINAFYGESHILHDVSLTLDDAETLAILGRNGVGKTTLIRSIVGTVQTRSGRITFDGQDVTPMPPHERSRLGISLIPQGRRILPNLTVAENLRVARTAAESTSWTLDDIYELFPRLEERTNQLGHSLSGGEQQMLAIARALIQHTELLLLDEPFEGLAPQIIESIYDRLQTIAEQDISVIIVGQNIEETLRLADRAYIVDNGRIVHESAADELLDDAEAQQRWLGVGETE